jgi:predicted RNA-binding Zn-ribbon protein involved in translation (DUF1610 family)
VDAGREPRAKPLFEFLASRDARLSCPLCGHEHWTGWDDRIVLVHATPERDPIEAVPLTCANCGFIRLQSARVLADPRNGHDKS